ncbi:MAG: hypothetical protein IPM12_11315 [Flavobacteriales bacterium]|nr:hypothetical protein [Flavobacteriales bacterium]
MRALRLFALPVALLLLTAQCIPALWQMHCADTGRTTAHWGTAKSCCMHEEATSEVPTVGNLCCTFSKVQAVLDVQQRTAATHVPDIATWVSIGYVAYVAPTRPVEPLSWFAHKPPLRGSILDGLVELGILRL